MSRDLMQAAQDLADVLKQENEALKCLDFPAAVALVAAKEAALAELTRHPPAEPATPTLAAIGQILHGLATDNQTMLERAIAVQTRIVRIVARAGAPSPTQTQYGHPGEPARSARATALAVSTRA